MKLLIYEVRNIKIVIQDVKQHYFHVDFITMHQLAVETRVTVISIFYCFP